MLIEGVFRYPITVPYQRLVYGRKFGKIALAVPG